MLGQPDDTPAFHPRGTLLVGALGGRIRRCVTAGAVVATIVGFVAAWVVREAPVVVAVLVPAVLGSLAGTLAAYVLVPRGTRRAFEAFSWLARREIDRMRDRTGIRPPGSPAEGATWLEANPRSPATAVVRLEVLAMLGRAAEARAEAALLPPPSSLAQAAEQALNRSFATFVETGTFDTAEIDALLADDALDPATRQEVLVGRAVGETRWRLDQGRDDWADPLAAAHAAVGYEARMTAVRDTWARVALTLLVPGFVVAVLLALSTLG